MQLISHLGCPENSLLATARRKAEEEELLDLTGFCVCEFCGWGKLTYASMRTSDELSIYFLIALLDPQYIANIG
jgi:hypothetical protein